MANKLRQYREVLGLSQEQLAEELGMKRTTIHSYETGHRTPPFHTADKIAAYFGVPVEEIFPQFRRRSPYPKDTVPAQR